MAKAISFSPYPFFSWYIFTVVHHNYVMINRFLDLYTVYIYVSCDCCFFNSGVRLHMVIGSQETSSVYDNILFHIEFYTPDSLETERKVEFLSQMLVTNPSINCVNDEILDLWQACPDPPGALSIQALSAIPDISNVVIHYHYDKDKATSRSVSE